MRLCRASKNGVQIAFKAFVREHIETHDFVHCCACFLIRNANARCYSLRACQRLKNPNHLLFIRDKRLESHTPFDISARAAAI